MSEQKSQKGERLAKFQLIRQTWKSSSVLNYEKTPEEVGKDEKTPEEMGKGWEKLGRNAKETKIKMIGKEFYMRKKMYKQFYLY